MRPSRRPPRTPLPSSAAGASSSARYAPAAGNPSAGTLFQTKLPPAVPEGGAGAGAPTPPPPQQPKNPVRTTKTSQKLVVLPSAPQTRALRRTPSDELALAPHGTEEGGLRE